LKHGLLGTHYFLPLEDPGELARMGEGLLLTLKPVGELEDQLVRHIISLYWRLLRMPRIEAGILGWQFHQTNVERASKYLEMLEGKRTGIESWNPEEYKRVAEFRKYHREEQESDIAAFGAGFVRDSREENALANLSRYETSLYRNLSRALHELERCQAARKGQPVPVPVAVDVNVSGMEGHRIDHDAKVDDQSYAKPQAISRKRKPIATASLSTGK
jgi:hypothetical protein